MRITIVTLGSRGDVQPFIALGTALQARGHTVIINTHSTFETFVCSYGLDFAPMAGDPETFLHAMTRSRMGANLFQFVIELQRWASSFADQAILDMLRACEGSDLVVYGFLGIVSHFVAEKLGIPAVGVFLMPIWEQTGVYPSVNALPMLPRTPAGHRLGYQLEKLMVDWMFRPMIGKFRVRVLNLPRLPLFGFPYDTLRGKRTPRLFCYSPSVIARPADWHGRDHVHIPGYLFLDDHQHWTPPAALTDFLNAGAPPVYIGFGSLVNDQPEAMLQLVLDALAKSGQRGLLLSGWGGFSSADLPETVFKIDSAPHDWLFPHMSAVVHHGGAGTTAAGLRAGVPSIVIPFFGDQPYWGARVRELGVGAAPISARDLTADRLAAAITEVVNTPQIRERAAALGYAIRAENGTQAAADILERLMEKPA